MKALSLTQPWAQLIVDDRKHIETRSWSTRHRGLLAVHAAIGFPGYAKKFASVERTLGRVPARIACGAILGLVRVVDVQPTWQVAPSLTPLEKLYGDYGEGRYAWIIELVGKLDEPIPCQGALGLWDVPDEIRSQLVALLPMGVAEA